MISVCTWYFSTNHPLLFEILTRRILGKYDDYLGISVFNLLSYVVGVSGWLPTWVNIATFFFVEVEEFGMSVTHRCTVHSSVGGGCGC